MKNIKKEQPVFPTFFSLQITAKIIWKIFNTVFNETNETSLRANYTCSYWDHLTEKQMNGNNGKLLRVTKISSFSISAPTLVGAFRLHA